MQTKPHFTRALRTGIAAAFILAAALTLAACGQNSGSSSAPVSSVPASSAPAASSDGTIQLGQGLVVTDIGRYAGVYMEDGSDEVLSDILMIVVRNTADRTVQYAQIQLESEARTTNFALTTLPPGEAVVLLETARAAYDPDEVFTGYTLSNTAFFPQEPTLCEDRLQLQALDGALNITNISGQDIPGEVTIYYKNAAADLYYGGITYRVTIKDGIKADEIKQLMAGHFSAKGSKVMFVTIAEPQS